MKKLIVMALAMITASVCAQNFTTINGKVFEDATVTRVDVDGIALKTKTGVTKVYFNELPDEVAKQFGYNPAKAAEAYAVQYQAWQEANRRAAAVRQEQAVAYARMRPQIEKQQALQNLGAQYQDLVAQEQDLLAEIGRIQNNATVVRRQWYDHPLYFNSQPYRYTDPDEARLPLLKGQLANVQIEKERVRAQYDALQHELLAGR